jgi:allantoinase
MTDVPRGAADGGDASDLTLAGRVVTAHRPPFRGWVRVRAGVIEFVSDRPEPAPATSVLDVGDRYILPGFVDVHVHTSSRPEEGIGRTTAAAAAGGVTTMIDMPYDVPRPIDHPDLVATKGSQIGRDAHVDVALLATVPPSGGTPLVPKLLAAGACGIMVSLWEQDRRRFPRIEYGDLREIFREAAAAGGVVSMHPETDAIIRPLLEQALRSPDQTDWRLHARSRPPVSETHAVLTALEFAREAGARVHLHQLSLARSFDLVAWYRDEGTRATGEALLHHLMFEENDLATAGGRLKLNPPLRSAANREALWERLAADTLPIVASDHSPWLLGDKTRPHILENASGLPGLETFPSVLLSAALARAIPLERIAQVTALTPAQTFGLGSVKGDIRPGLDADLIVFDPSVEWTVDRRALHTWAGWDAYDDRRLQGRVITTIARGRVVWDGTRVLAKPGWGRWLQAGE